MLYSRELIEEFHRINSYGLSLEDFKKVCNSPWEFLRSEMESGELETVRFKYFGIFQVRLGRATRMLIDLKRRFDNHLINPKEYFKYKKMLDKFVEKHGEKN